MDKSGRWAVETYLSAWERLCDATWRKELEDPLFAQAVKLAIEDDHQPTPPDEAPWPHREAWRDYIRSWWWPAREHYASPDDIELGWIIGQHERDAAGYPGIIIYWEPEREASLRRDVAATAYTARRDATWQHMRALIATGEFWPLQLDGEHAARVQFDTLRTWATAATSESATAAWGHA
jgi:hypothetical protein